MVTDTALAPVLIPEGAAFDKWSDELLSQFSTFIEGATVVINRMPTPEERRTLSHRHRMVEAALVGVSTKGSDFSETKKLLAQFFLGYPSLLNADAPGLVTAYVSDLRSLPLYAIRQALDDIKHGRVTVSDGKGRQMPLDKDWPPSSTRVYDIAVKVSDARWREFQKLNHVLGTVRLARPEITEAERARVGAKIKTMADEFRRSTPDESGSIVDASQEAALRAEAEKLRQRQAREMEYRSAGLEPLYADAAKTLVISLPLMLSMGHKIETVGGVARLVGPAKEHERV